MIISIGQFQLFFLALTRVLAILIQVPVFGGPMIPNQVKLALGVVLSLIVIPWQPLTPETAAMPFLSFIFAISRELIIGVLAGFAGTLTFGAFQVAGKLMDMSSGFGAGQIFNPAMGDTGSAMDQLFTLVALLFFLITNGHHTFLLGLQKTFVVLPLNMPLPDLAPARLLQMTAGFILIGVQLSLPVVGALLLTDLTLGMLAKVAPQVNVFFLGLPIKVWVGVMGLMLVFSSVVPIMGDMFHNLGNRMLEILGV
jgi:flagellar biosynthesis protein FliR